MTMTLFRPHRSTLAQAMKECEPCTNRAELEAILARGDFPMELISVEPYGRDERIGWDTYIVKAQLNGKPQSVPCVAGFVNGPLTS